MGVAAAYEFAGRNRDRYAEFFEADGSLAGPGLLRGRGRRPPEPVPDPGRGDQAAAEPLPGLPRAVHRHLHPAFTFGFTTRREAVPIDPSHPRRWHMATQLPRLRRRRSSSVGLLVGIGAGDLPGRHRPGHRRCRALPGRRHRPGRRLWLARPRLLRDSCSGLFFLFILFGHHPRGVLRRPRRDRGWGHGYGWGPGWGKGFGPGDGARLVARGARQPDRRVAPPAPRRGGRQRHRGPQPRERAERLQRHLTRAGARRRTSPGPATAASPVTRSPIAAIPISRAPLE